MMETEPLVFPSRRYYPLDVGIADRQLWAIGMVVTQWGMTEFIREQEISSLIGEDVLLAAQYKKERSSQQKTRFWKTLIETKKQEPDRTKWLDFATRFETLNNQRDDIVHRLWGGGIQSKSWGAPAGVETTDAALHRNHVEKIKTKSTDARANLRWRLSFGGLREIARNIAQLNNDLLASWLPPGTPPEQYDVWAFTLPNGQLTVGIAPRSSPVGAEAGG